jgi:RNA polymerase sigma-70 factor (sigma-E family)
MGREQTQEEFERFVASSADDLLRTGYMVVWDLPEAEDLVQECLFRIARRWPRVRSMEHPAAYARRILVNLALDGAKRRRHHGSELDLWDRLPAEEPHDESAEQALGAVETSGLIGALEKLAPRQRAVLALRYFDDLSEAQVAEVLGCSVGNVKSTKSRALERLRQVLALTPAEGNNLDALHIGNSKGANENEPATRG